MMNDQQDLHSPRRWLGVLVNVRCYTRSCRPSPSVVALTVRCLCLLLVLALFSAPAGAQSISIGFEEGTGLTERAVQLVALITILSLAPSILVMVTSFTRIVVVLSLLRTAIGIQQSPPNAVMISLALFAWQDWLVIKNRGQASRRNRLSRIGNLPPRRVRTKT